MKKIITGLFLVVSIIKSADMDPRLLGSFFLNLTTADNIALSTTQDGTTSSKYARVLGLAHLPLSTQSNGTIKISRLFPLLAPTFIITKKTPSIVLVQYSGSHLQEMHLENPWNTLLINRTNASITVNEAELENGSKNFFSIAQKEGESLTCKTTRGITTFTKLNPFNIDIIVMENKSIKIYQSE